MKSTFSKRNGHERYATQHKDTNHKSTVRRQKALQRLENQVLTGFKAVNNEDGTIGTAPLTDVDKVRIKKEIEILKTKIQLGN